jgi:hypothetical protein
LSHLYRVYKRTFYQDRLGPIIGKALKKERPLPQALALGGVGFATTTDIQRELHPPDKQDVAARLLLELRRCVSQVFFAMPFSPLRFVRSLPWQIIVHFSFIRRKTHIKASPCCTQRVKQKQAGVPRRRGLAGPRAPAVPTATQDTPQR